MQVRGWSWFGRRFKNQGSFLTKVVEIIVISIAKLSQLFLNPLSNEAKVANGSLGLVWQKIQEHLTFD